MRPNMFGARFGGKAGTLETLPYCLPQQSVFLHARKHSPVIQPSANQSRVCQVVEAVWSIVKCFREGGVIRM